MVLRVREDKRECVWREGKGDRGTKNPKPSPLQPEPSIQFVGIHSLKHS